MKRFFLVIGILLIFVLVFSLFILKIRTVSCVTASHLQCPQTISSSLDEYKGRPIGLNFKKITNYLEKLSLIDNYSTKISLLGDISVLVKLRQSDLALKAETVNEYSLYTKDGAFVEILGETSLPYVLIKDKVETRKLEFVVKLAYQLTKILAVKQMFVVSDSLVVELYAQKLYFPLEGDIDVLLGSVAITFSQLNQEGQVLIINGEPVKISEIDFRFSNPVLR